MSFSTEVRSELAAIVSGSRKTMLAAEAAIIDCIGTWKEKEDGSATLFIRTDNRFAVTKCFTLLQKTANIICMLGDLSEGPVLDLSRFFSAQDLQQIAAQLGVFSGDDGRIPEHPGIPDRLLSDDKCSRAFLRNTFLCLGSVSDPSKEYQLEFNCPTKEKALQIQRLMEAREIPSGYSVRRGYHVIYLRDSGQIVDMLNLMGAGAASMKMENAIILRQMRGSINRKVNCETANIRKSAQAALRQLEDIRLLTGSSEFAALPDHLREIALVRIENPDVSLKELGEMLDPPVGKSGVNHRLRKLSEIAASLRTGSQIQDHG